MTEMIEWAEKKNRKDYYSWFPYVEKVRDMKNIRLQLL